MIKISIDQCSALPVKTLIFSGGEVQVRLEELEPWPSAVTVAISTNVASSDDLMELLLVTDAVRRKFGDLIEVHLQMPYLPYARQDRVCYPGEALSLKVFCDLINAQRYASVEIWDCHSDVGLALLDRVVHVPAERLIKRLRFDNESVLVAPDAGAVRRVSACAKALERPMIQAVKTRDPNTGAITGTKILDPVSHMRNQDFLIVDDICDGGRTFIELAKVLKQFGARDIDLYVTHGIFSRGFGEIGPLFKHIFVANLFPQDDRLPDQVHVIGGQ